MRTGAVLAIALPLVLAAPSARAEDPPPDPTTAFFAGAATTITGIVIGSSIMAFGHQDDQANNVGWLTMMGGFTLAPLVAHGIEGEWIRGLGFASIPGAMTALTGALFTVVPGTVDSGTLGEQRLMWGFYGIAFAGAAVGVVDAMFASRRAPAHELVVTPFAGADRVGLEIMGSL